MYFADWISCSFLFSSSSASVVSFFLNLARSAFLPFLDGINFTAGCTCSPTALLITVFKVFVSISQRWWASVHTVCVLFMSALISSYKYCLFIPLFSLNRFSHALAKYKTSFFTHLRTWKFPFESFRFNFYVLSYFFEFVRVFFRIRSTDIL